MSTPISETQFHESEGVDDWRAVFWGACAVFRTDDYATAAQFATSIAEIAEELGHYPDIDLRQGTVAVRTGSSNLSDRDVILARKVSAAARQLGLDADPGNVQHVQFTFDVVDGEPIKAFWEAALGYEREGDDDLVDPRRSSPPVWFQKVEHHQLPHNRIHVDVSVPHDVAEQRVNAILGAGGRMLGDKHAPAWWSLVDAEGNVVDIATWQGRE
ncbi:MAG: 4a-hydroxytetrahydrobiopterin dehydratase [Acidimicrobiia bacterium]|nr:4a-hydroxytetrahydrobiopterin dehydratase [Acidimicrobiia bacterium]